MTTVNNIDSDYVSAIQTPKHSGLPLKIGAGVCLTVALVALALLVTSFIPPAAAVIIPVARAAMLAVQITSGVAFVAFSAIGTTLLALLKKTPPSSEKLLDNEEHDFSEEYSDSMPEDGGDSGSDTEYSEAS